MQLKVSCVVEGKPAANPAQIDFRYTFVANNVIVVPVIFASPSQLLSFRYFIANDTGKDMAYGLIHIVLADYKLKEGFFVNGFMPVPDDVKPTDIDVELPPPDEKTPPATIKARHAIREVPKTSTSSDPQSDSSQFSFSLDTPALKKSPIGLIIVDEYEVVIEGNVKKYRGTGKRLVIRYGIQVLENGSSLTRGGPYVRRSGTHVIALEGTFAPFVGNVTGALTTVANGISAAIPQLNRTFDAQILETHTATAVNSKGERIAKVTFIVKEQSPIAPLVVIIGAVAGLAAVAGIIFAIGYVQKTSAEIKEVQTREVFITEMARQLGDRQKTAEMIATNPNLTTEQKTQMLDSLSRYYNALTTDAERTTTFLNGFAMPKIDWQNALFWGVVIAAVAAGGYIVYTIAQEERERRGFRRMLGAFV
jgi:aspartate 1-decarboxylase